MFIKKIINSFFPPTCLLCHEITQLQALLCENCSPTLPWIKPHELSTELFLRFNITQALFYYQPPIDYFISSLKFEGKMFYAHLLSQLFTAQLKNRREPLPEYLLPMPLHRQRLCERGFNQALVLAKPIARHLQIPITTDLCQRRKYTQPQTYLSAKHRARNIKNAFVIHKPLNIKHLAIVDDVVTTGSTVSALTAVLKNYGVEKIEVWCIAKTNF